MTIKPKEMQSRIVTSTRRVEVPDDRDPVEPIETTTQPVPLPHSSNELAQVIKAPENPVLHILIVEDQIKVRRVLRRALERRNVQVDEASNGLEGLAKMKSTLYDCVLSGQSNGIQIYTL